MFLECAFSCLEEDHFTISFTTFKFTDPTLFIGGEPPNIPPLRNLNELPPIPLSKFLMFLKS